MSPAFSSAHELSTTKNTSLVILGETDSFSRRDAPPRARLAKRNLTGHVIHDDPDVDPIFRPSESKREEQLSNDTWEEIWRTHRRAVLTRKNHEIEARNIILERLSEKVWPRDHIRLSAKALYDSVSSPRRETSSATYIDALRQFQAFKLNDSIERYCNEFQTAYQNKITAAEALSMSDDKPTEWAISEATVAGFF